MEESERGQEQLYICNHAVEVCSECVHRFPHKIVRSCDYGCHEDWGGQVECIPYKEEPETVDQVLESLPDLGSYTDDPDGDMSPQNAIDLALDYASFKKRYEAAKEWEEA
jgi:hypothetical protein